MANTRNRILKHLKGITKSSSTKEILGIDLETYKQMDRMANDSRNELG